MSLKKTLPACVMAALFLPVLFAQGQTDPGIYIYRHASSTPPVCDAQTHVSVADARQYALQALKDKQLPAVKCWFELADAQGDEAATASLAMMYYQGYGVPVDLPKALRLAMRAAKGNAYLGDEIIGQMYETGNGLPKNTEEAAFWKKKATEDKTAWAEQAEAKNTQANPPQNTSASAERPKYGPDGPKPSCDLTLKPQVMHFCAQNCYTFNMEQDGKLHNYTNHTGQSNVQRIFDIEKWTPDSVIIHRIDYGSSPRDERMQGRMQNGACAAVSAYGDWRISWGANLGDIYGSNEERAMAQGGNPDQQAGLDNVALLWLFLRSLPSVDTPEPKKSSYGCAPGACQKVW